MHTSYDSAVAHLLDEFSWNPWFLAEHWPENVSRVRSMVAAVSLAPARDNAQKRRVLDLGCANGYVTYLLHQMGYDVSGADAYEDPKRTELFARLDIPYRETNLNSPAPLAGFPDAAYEAVVLGEVFEHILNHPAGLLRAIHRILVPGGVLVLTTPNPSTLVNAFRLLADRYVMWGTAEFLRDVKIDGDRIIDRGDIHYREYPAWMVRDLLTEVGFEIRQLEYYPMEPAAKHSRGKKAVKFLLSALRLSRRRPFAFGYLIAAAKPR